MQAAERRFLGDAGGTRPAADQPPGHIRSDGEELFGRTGRRIVDAPGCQSGKEEGVGYVLEITPVNVPQACEILEKAGLSAK